MTTIEPLSAFFMVMCLLLTSLLSAIISFLEVFLRLGELIGISEISCLTVFWKMSRAPWLICTGSNLLLGTNFGLWKGGISSSDESENTAIFMSVLLLPSSWRFVLYWSQKTLSLIDLKSFSKSVKISPMSGSPGVIAKDRPLLRIFVWSSSSGWSERFKTRFSGINTELLFEFQFWSTPYLEGKGMLVTYGEKGCLTFFT